MKYSVTTVALPKLDMAGQCEFLRKLGFDGMELRVRRVTDEIRAKAEPAMWGYHVNDVTPENLKEKAPELKKMLDDNGLKLAGLATGMSCNDMEQFKNTLEGAVAIGAPFIRLGATASFSPIDGGNYKAIYGETVAGYARCIELAKGTGIKMILEMHGYQIHPSASLALKIVSNFSPSEAGIIYDPQNMVRDGFESPAITIPMLGDYIAHCHFGAHRPVAGDLDENGTRQWKWEGCDMNEGLFNFPIAMKFLKQIDYKGFISIEDFRTNISDEEKFSGGLAYLKKIEKL